MAAQRLACVVLAFVVAMGLGAEDVPEYKEDGGNIKYQIKWSDPFGALAAAGIFFGFVAMSSATVLIWCCVDEAADPSVFPACYPRFGKNAAAVRARKDKAAETAEE